MSLPLPDFGLTSWVDFTNDSEITADAQLRVSAVGDSLGLINDFTQGTDANKPLWSRSDNKENLVLYSDDANNAAWVKAATTVTSNVITADAGNAVHRINQNASAPNAGAAGGVAGSTYNAEIVLDYINYPTVWVGFQGTSVWIGVRVNLVNNTVDNNSNTTSPLVTTVSGNRKKITFSFTRATTGAMNPYIVITPDGTQGTNGSFTATGTEQVGFVSSKLKKAGVEFLDTPTTDYSQYAGVNGRRCLVFNGAQAILSTSQLGSIVANNNKLIYIVMQPFELTTSTSIFRDAGPYMAVFGGTSGDIRFRNFDGTNDDVSIAGSLAPMIFRGRHTGGNVYAAIDTGAGFSESAPVASGDTTLMTDTIRVGNTSTGFYGKILGIATANTGAAKPNLENLLREYFFARSQLRWDPYLADLVLKRQ